MASDVNLTPRQCEALLAAYKSSDGWIYRGFSRIWGIAPMAVMALERKGYLTMPHGRGRARLTDQGRSLAEHLIKFQAGPADFAKPRRVVT